MAQTPAGNNRPLDPEKLLRIASLARAVLEEVRHLEPDEQSAGELAGLHGRVMTKLREAMPDELFRELDEIDLDIAFKKGATTNEIRVAYAGLIGWLGGLFQGLQAAMQLQSLQTHQLQRAQEDQDRESGEEGQPRGHYL